MHQTETLVIAFGPFVIVQERPVEEAFHIGALPDRPAGGLKMGKEIIAAYCVVYRIIFHHIGIGHAVFGDMDRQIADIVAGKADQEGFKPLGVDLPAHLGFWQIAGHIADRRPGLAGVGSQNMA